MGTLDAKSHRSEEAGYGAGGRGVRLGRREGMGIGEAKAWEPNTYAMESNENVAKESGKLWVRGTAALSFEGFTPFFFLLSLGEFCQYNWRGILVGKSPTLQPPGGKLESRFLVLGG